MLTTYDTDSDTLPAIEAGATGYLLKDAPRDELSAAVRAAADGRSVLSPAVASRLMTGSALPPTRRDRPVGPRAEVLVLVARGTTNRDRRRTLHQRGDREDPPHPCLRQTGRQDRAAAVAVGYDRGILG